MILGIDPGLNGGITILNRNGKLVGTYVMPTIISKKKKNLDRYAIKHIFKTSKPVLIAIEKQHAMPGQGVSSMFKIGLGYGTLLGLAEGLDIPVVEVSSRKWQKIMFDGEPKGDTKTTSRNVAKKIFNVSFLKSKRCTVPHDGLTDSALIAEWARREYLV